MATRKTKTQTLKQLRDDLHEYALEIPVGENDEYSTEALFEQLVGDSHFVRGMDRVVGYCDLLLMVQQTGSADWRAVLEPEEYRSLQETHAAVASCRSRVTEAAELLGAVIQHVADAMTPDEALEAVRFAPAADRLLRERAPRVAADFDEVFPPSLKAVVELVDESDPDELVRSILATALDEDELLRFAPDEDEEEGGDDEDEEES